MYCVFSLEIYSRNQEEIYRNLTHLHLVDGEEVDGFPWRFFEKLEFVDVDTDTMLQADVQALVSGTKGHLKAV